MRNLGAILLGSVAGLALIGAAQAADLPTKKAPIAPPPANCYASFWSWLDSTAADCPLSLYGVTVYGQVDVGGGYETAATKFNPDYPNGVYETPNKSSGKAAWQWVPNGLSQSNVGVKIKEQVVPGWYIVGDANFGFDPYSFSARQRAGVAGRQQHPDQLSAPKRQRRTRAAPDSGTTPAPISA